jgi:hypothetical protein
MRETVVKVRKFPVGSAERHPPRREITGPVIDGTINIRLDGIVDDGDLPKPRRGHRILFRFKKEGRAYHILPHHPTTTPPNPK